MLLVEPLAWNEVVRVASDAWPDEACGLLFARSANRRAAVEAVGMENVARDRSRAFRMSELDLMRVLRDPRRDGRELCAIFHTHPRGAATLSPADRRALAPADEPLWPGIAQLVLAVRASGVVDAASYSFDEGTCCYLRERLVTADRPAA